MKKKEIKFGKYLNFQKTKLNYNKLYHIQIILINSNKENKKYKLLNY